MVKPLFSKAPLVAKEFISAILPLFLYFLDFINIHYPGNKGIRLKLVDVASATKGALEDKGLLIRY